MIPSRAILKACCAGFILEMKFDPTGSCYQTILEIERVEVYARYNATRKVF